MGQKTFIIMGQSTLYFPPMAYQETGGKHPLPAVTIFYPFDGHHRRVQLFVSATLQQFLQTISGRHARQPEKSDAGRFGVSLPVLTFYDWATRWS